MRDVGRVELGSNTLRAAQPARQPAGGGDRHLAAARLERARGVVAGPRDDGAAEAVVSRTASTTASSTTRRSSCASRSARSSRRCSSAILLVVIVVMVFLQTWRASIIPLVAVPVSLVGTFAVMLGARLLAEHAVALRPGPRHRHRRRRCDRGGGERGAAHRARADADRGDAQGDGRSVGPDHRDRAGAVRGVRADGVHQRPDRAVLPAVRADDRDLDGDLGVQLADAEPGAGVAAAAAARRAARSRAAGHRPACSAGSSGCSTASSRARRASTPAAWRACCAWRSAALVVYVGLIGLTVARVLARAAGLRADAGQGLPGRVRAAARRRDARSHRGGDPEDVRHRAEASGRGERRSRSRACRSTASSTRRTPASCSSMLKPVEERHGARAGRRQRSCSELNAQFAGIQEAFVAIFPPPPVQGLGHGRRLQALRRGSRRPRVRGAVLADAGRARAGLRDAVARRACSRASRSTCRRSTRTSIASAPRPTACALDRRLRDAAGLPRLALRERLQPVRPDLSGQRAGGVGVPPAAGADRRA